ncbi:hypothetical protein LUZ63_016285 [Rhynchospora breviuscula]|uniref:Uncharacterized protein n=1 Tax=Rhynchospora breviuscula TaxID=2022672 RepID=A0A9P9Z9L6_9POAL|nr:hypothetical protein LUZ63_016285 [Rhynchospora breviuscula]
MRLWTVLIECSTASAVFPSSQQNIQETLIDPPIKGTTNVLRSCSRASSMRRVVLTSSCSAVRYRDDATLVSPLAEEEAWRPAKELEIELVVVNPSFVIGPLLAPNPTSTPTITLAVLKGKLPSYPNLTIGFVHVDNVVQFHIITNSPWKTKEHQAA